jgi:hypothetical protein
LVVHFLCYGITHLRTRLALGSSRSWHTDFLANVEFLTAWLNMGVIGYKGGESFKFRPFNYASFSNPMNG